MTDDPRKRGWIDLLNRIKRGMTGTSHGPLFVATPRDIALIDQMADYIERSDIKETDDGDDIH